MIRRILKQVNLWSIVSIIVASVMLLPFLHLFPHAIKEATPAWLLIKEYLLLDILKNTFIIVLATALLSSVLGTFFGYVVVFYRFPFRRFFRWTLILPLALPAYLLGYIYANMFSFTGIIPKILRDLFAWSLPASFSILNITGVVLIFSLTLYPYVYMATKSYLEKQPATLFDAAHTLNANSLKVLFKVTLPLLRPAIAASTLLVLMEVLSDYGLVSYFGVPVFSTAIFQAWFTSGDVVAAIKLSVYLLLVLFFLLILERIVRGRRAYRHHKTNARPIVLKTLPKPIGWLVVFIMGGVLFVVFVIPLVQLLLWASQSLFLHNILLLAKATFHTYLLATVATITILVLSLFLINFKRSSSRVLAKTISSFTTMGYAIPGAIVAIAVVLMFTQLDKNLVFLYRIINPNSIVLVLTTSIVMLFFAYVFRFMAIGYNNIEASYEKIGTQYTNVSYTLGKGKIATLLQVDLPLLRPGMIAAFIIVFIDIVKELPLTLILRPFNFTTLATLIYQYASDEMIQEAAIPSIVLILTSTIAIYIITHRKKKGTSYGHPHQ